MMRVSFTRITRSQAARWSLKSQFTIRVEILLAPATFILISIKISVFVFF